MEHFERPSSAHNPDDGKTIAIISYITLIGLVVAYVMNSDKKNQFAAFHIRQSVGIMLTGVVLGFVSIIPFLGWIAFIVGWIFVVVMWVTGLLNAINGKAQPVVGLGAKYDEWFASLK